MQVYLSRDKIDYSFISVYPGDWVVIKPNLIKQCSTINPNEWRSVITDPALIEEVCLYVCDQLSGKGKVTICDAPQTDSSFFKILEVSGLEAIAARCQRRTNTKVEITDLRNEEWKNEKGVIVKRQKIAGDLEGTIVFNLGKDGLFYGFSGEGRYYGADYNSSVVRNHHVGELQEYLICGTPIKADVYINMPKMKTHKKTGVTLNLKNLVGINADKNWLPHHTEGNPRTGGDEYPDSSLKRSLENAGVKLCRKLAQNLPVMGALLAQLGRSAGEKVFGDGRSIIRSGNWYGNDTCWRMVLDLNRCLLYGSADGSIRSSNRKRYYSVVDGRIGMEGAGPMEGTPIHSRLIAGGDNPLAVDIVVARAMGFDWRKIPMLREAFNLKSYPIAEGSIEDIQILSDVIEWNGPFIEVESADFLRFEPHFGWKGHIEFDPSQPRKN